MLKKQTYIAFTLFLFCVSMTLASCRGADKALQEKISFDSIVGEKLGKKYDVSYNASKSYALCQQQREGDHSQRSFKYLVVRLADNKVIREGSFKMGHVKWRDDISIEVITSSSVKDDQGKREIISIKSEQ